MFQRYLFRYLNHLKTQEDTSRSSLYFLWKQLQKISGFDFDKLVSHLQQLYEQKHILEKVIKNSFLIQSLNQGLDKNCEYDQEIQNQEYLRFLWYSLSMDFIDYIQGQKIKDNICDYHDLLYYMRDLVYNETIREKILEEIDYLFVDEYQDVDPIQDEIFENLATSPIQMAHDAKSLILIRVGDGNQSIYGFRGANHQHFFIK